MIKAIIGIVLAVTLTGCDDFRPDSTDGYNNTSSGMSIRVDNYTGVQYLIAQGGGMTVRVKRDGTPLTIQDEQRGLK